MDGSIGNQNFRNILAGEFSEIEYKDAGIEKRVNVINVLERLSDWTYDTDIADDLQVKVVTIRRLLNELHEYNLVAYKRTKNKDTGWYTYVWKIREDKSEDYVSEYFNLHLLNLRNNLENEKNNMWFNCSCSSVTHDDALKHNFLCPVCGETYGEGNRSEKIAEIEMEITKLEELMRKI